MRKEANAIGPYFGNLMRTTLPVDDLSDPKIKLEVLPDDDYPDLEDWDQIRWRASTWSSRRSRLA